MGTQVGLVSFVNLMNDEDLEEDLLIGGIFDALGKEHLPQLSPLRDEPRRAKRKRFADIDKDPEAWLEALCSESQKLKRGAGGSPSEEKSDVVDGQEQPGSAPKEEAESEEDSDCVMLDGNPETKEKDGKEAAAGGPVVEDEVEVTKEVGLVACRDFPHARFSCVKFPFKKGHHKEYCALCHCYVCDAPAPCPKWGDGSSIIHHCHADHKDPFWKNMRQSLKQQAVRKAEAKKDASAGSVSETFQMWGVQNSPPEGGGGESVWGQISFEACFGTMAWGGGQGTPSVSGAPTAVDSWTANRYLQALTQRLAAPNRGQTRAPAGRSSVASRPRARRAPQSPHTTPRTPLDFAPSPPPLPTEAPPPPPTEPFPGAATPAVDTPLPRSNYSADHSAYPYPGLARAPLAYTDVQPAAAPPYNPYAPQNVSLVPALSALYAQAPSSGRALPGYPSLHSDLHNQVANQLAALPPPAWNGVHSVPSIQNLPTYSGSQGGLVRPQQPLVQAYTPPQEQHILQGSRSISSQQGGAHIPGLQPYSCSVGGLVPGDGASSQPSLEIAQVSSQSRGVAHGNHASQGPAAAGAWQASGSWEKQGQRGVNLQQPLGRALGYEAGTEYEPWEQPWSWNV